MHIRNVLSMEKNKKQRFLKSTVQKEYNEWLEYVRESECERKG